MRVLKSFLKKHGNKICSLAVLATSFGVLSCRGIFFQPEEPENIGELL